MKTDPEAIKLPLVGPERRSAPAMRRLFRNPLSPIAVGARSCGPVIDKACS
jgi:hypothetical protein